MSGKFDKANKKMFKDNNNNQVDISELKDVHMMNKIINEKMK